MKDIKRYINLFEEHNIITNENYKNSYNINKDCVVIGITGSKGKSSACYLLYDYLTKQGKKVCMYSSSGVYNPYTYFVQGSSVCGVTTLEEMSDFIAGAEQSMTDYIIIECNAEAILEGVYDDLEFDYKVLTYFDQYENEHIDEDEYLQLKLNFFRNNPCKSIINIDGENISEFYNVSDDIFTFSINREDANLFSTFSLPYVDKSYIEFYYDGNDYNLVSTIPLKTGVKSTIAFLSILAGMNKFDELENIKEYLKNDARINGRLEDIQWNGRTIMIDSGNDVFIKNTIAELNSQEFQDAREEYIAKYGEDFIQTEYNNVRALFSCIGGIDEGRINRLREDPNFKFLNAVSDEDSEVRRNFLIFGTNFYLMKNKLKELPYVLDEDGNWDIVYEEVRKEFGDADVYCDFTNQNQFTQEYLDNLYNEMCKVTRSLIRATRETFYYNFTWRSIVALKEFFSLSANKKDFVLISNYFKSLGNEELTNACNFIEEKLNVVNNQYDVAMQDINAIEQSTITKLYITYNQYSQSGCEYLIQNMVDSLKEGIAYETIVDRKEAIKKMIEESQEGDLILVCGRGSRDDFINQDMETEFWTDKEYVEELIK